LDRGIHPLLTQPCATSSQTFYVINAANTVRNVPSILVYCRCLTPDPHDSTPTIHRLFPIPMFLPLSPQLGDTACERGCVGFFCLGPPRSSVQLPVRTNTTANLRLPCVGGAARVSLPRDSLRDALHTYAAMPNELCLCASAACNCRCRFEGVRTLWPRDASRIRLFAHIRSRCGAECAYLAAHEVTLV
jgi:hypothetical protein